MVFSLALIGLGGLIFIFSIWIYRKSDVFIRIGIVLMVAILIPDFWVLVDFVYPETASMEYDLWLSNTYHEKLNALWYFYGVGSYLSRLLFALIVSKIASLVSFKLYKVSITVVIFYIIQFAFWLYNKNTSVWANYLVYLAIICVIIHLIIPDKHQAKYRIMEHNYD